jgi:hypothetical protein
MITARRSTALACILLVLAACSDASTSDNSASGASNTTAAGNGATTTEAAPSTGVGGLSATDFEGQWIVLRRLTTNDGYWNETPAPPMEFRIYDITCSTPDCGEMSATVARANGVVNTDHPLTMRFDGERLTASDEWTSACKNPTTSVYDGPENSQGNASIDLQPVMVDGTLSSFAGDYSLTLVTDGSADCVAEDVGYTSEMVMFRVDAVSPLALADGVYYGDGWIGQAARGVQGCADDACRFREPYPLNTVTGTQVVWIEGTLTPDGAGYTASVDFTDACSDPATGAWLADDAYATHVDASVSLVQVAGFDQPVLLTKQEINAQANTGAPAACPSFAQTFWFAGVAVDAPDLIDFTAPNHGVDA